MSGREFLSEYEERLRATGEFGRLAESRRAVGLPVPAAAWVALADARERSAPWVVVPHEIDALRWIEAWEFFGGAATFFRAPSLTLYQGAEIPLSVRAGDAEAFHRGLTDRECAVVCTPAALFRQLPRGEDFLDLTLDVAVDNELDMTAWLSDLLRRGYRRADLVTQVGDFAVRGGVLDLYSPGFDRPLRLDFFGDTIESIRLFDPQTQRSQERRERATVLPMSLFPSGGDAADRLADQLTRLATTSSGSVLETVEQLRERGSFDGWENYLCLASDTTSGLGDVFSERELIVYDPDSVSELCRQHVEQVREEFEWRTSQGHLAIPPEQIEIDPHVVDTWLAEAELVLGGAVAELGVADFHAAPTEKLQGQLPRFPREIETARARSETVFLVAAPGHRRRVEQLIERYHPSRAGVRVVDGELDRGFRMPGAGFVLFSDHQLFEPLRPTGGAAKRFSSLVSGLRDLKVGDYVVHADHGIGRFDGLRRVGERNESERDLPPILVDDAESKTVAVEVMEIAYSGSSSFR